MRLVKHLTIWAMLILLSTAANADQEIVVEWAPFAIKQGVSMERLVQVAQNVEEVFLQKQKGYIKRSLLKGKPRQWVDIVYWQSESDANAAASAANNSPACLEYFALMEGVEQSEINHVQHYKLVKSWR
ncbi:MAG: hypothetical protein ACRBHB_15690 [Arenicella sp.]